MAWANLWRNQKRTVLVICSLTLGLVLMSYSYAKNVSFDVEKYLMDLTVADYEIDDATNNVSSFYDPASKTISDTMLAEIMGLGESSTVEATGRLYSRQKPLYPMVAGRDSLTFDLPLILPADVFTELWQGSNLRKFYFNVTEKAIEDAQALLLEYQQGEAAGMNVVSRQTMIEQYEAQTRASAVMGYAVSSIIALVGVLNFVNSMVTAIITRKREFAMIQSVGMTKRQLRQMLTFEGLFYARLTLFTAYILSMLTVSVILRAIVTAADGYSTFHFTLFPLICCTPVLIVIALVIPYLCFKNLEQQSIVERLRAVD